MKERGKEPSPRDELRRRAEQRARESALRPDPDSEAGVRMLLHELQVHQIELELQNEELERARTAAETLLEKYTDLYEFAPNGYATLDRGGVIRQINLTGAALLGLERGRIVGLKLEQFLDAQARPAWADFLKGAFALAEGPAREATFLQARLGARMVRLVAASLHDGAECRVSLEDVTERHSAEAARDEARRFLDALINAVGDPIFVKDRRRRYVMVNDAYCRFMGVARESLLGRDGVGVIPKENLEAFRKEDQRVLDSGRSRVNEVLVDCASGSAHTISIVRTLYTDPSGKQFIVGTFSDVTAHKRLEHHLREVDQLKSSMISLISHEYANALTTMRLAMHLLEAAEPQPVEASRRQSYEAVRRAIAHLKAATANFLNLNRLESGKLNLVLGPASMQAVALEVLAVLRPLAEAKRLRLRLETEPTGAPPAPVRADSEALSLILSNLIANALKYTPEGGGVTVRIAPDERDPRRVLFSVADTGIGIAAKDRENILSGFFRTAESRLVAKGFGVGLKLVKELLEKHGSRLEFESEPGRGSRFCFRLPLWGPLVASAGVKL